MSKPFNASKIVKELNVRSPQAPSEAKQLTSSLSKLGVKKGVDLEKFLKALQISNPKEVKNDQQVLPIV